MNRIVDCVCCLRGCLGVLLQLVGYLLRFCWALVLPRAVMAAQLLAIQSQLAVELNRSSGRRKRHSQFSPAFLISCGIREVRTAYRSPWQNPYIERFIGTLRRELFDHVIVLNQAHLERLLKEFIEDYYHTARPHQGLAGETPTPQAPPGEGELISVPVAGGLHHRYYRAAA